MAKQRLQSLDVLRGITVAGMILVNNGYGESFLPLRHARWNGMTPCDLVFPFFLFIVGVSICLALRKFQFQCSGPVVRKVIRRTFMIFFIGLAINWFDHAVGGDWLCFSQLRFWGVLQRIAICYCVVSLFALLVPHRYTLPVAALLLAVYAIILLWGNGYAEDGSNLAARIDNALFGYNHLYHKSPVDPEGLLGTLSAIAHTLIGFYAGTLLFKPADGQRPTPLIIAYRFLLLGGTLIVLGYLLQFGLPLNKRIWSPSYVLMTCGLASTLQALLMHLLDIRGAARAGDRQPSVATRFFLIFGVNPLFLYVLSELLAIVFGHFGISDVIYGGISSVISHPQWASLAFALTFVAICGLCGYPLWKRQIYIKI